MIAPVVAAAIEARRETPDGPRAWTVLMTPEGVPARPRAGERPRAPAAPPAGLRALRGDRRAGARLGLFDEEISLGDFVLPGGEAAALALTETVSRLVPGRRRSRRIAGTGVVPGRPSRLPALHAAARVPGPLRARRAAVRRPPENRALARAPRALERTRDATPGPAGAAASRRREKATSEPPGARSRPRARLEPG